MDDASPRASDGPGASPRRAKARADDVSPAAPARPRRLAELPLDELHRRYHETRDLDIRRILVERYAPMARSLANSHARSQADRDDATQVAFLGLVNAIDRFDPTRGFQFSTFAWATIRGELKRYHRDQGWAVRVPRRLQEVFLRTAAAVEELTHALGRSPTIPEIAQATGDPEEDVVAAIDVRDAWRASSIDAPVREDGSGLQIGIDEPGMEIAEDRSMLDPLLRRLPEREREILRLRFVEQLSQAEIAGRLGVSQMHISRILARTLARLRSWAGEPDSNTAS